MNFNNEIESLLYEAEKTIKKIKEPQNDSQAMQIDANRNREYGQYSFDKCVGKITIGPLCFQETLKSFTKSNITPHTILQIETW